MQTHGDDHHPAIPYVLCPRCGTHMRLAELSTDLREHETIYFDCSCGFEYRMSPRVKAHATVATDR